MGLGCPCRASPRPGGRASPGHLSRCPGSGWQSRLARTAAPEAERAARRSDPRAAAGPRRRACASARRVQRPLTAGGASVPLGPAAPCPALPAARWLGGLAQRGPRRLVSSRYPPAEAEPRTCQRGAGGGFVWRRSAVSLRAG